MSTPNRAAKKAAAINATAAKTKAATGAARITKPATGNTGRGSYELPRPVKPRIKKK